MRGATDRRPTRTLVLKCLVTKRDQRPYNVRYYTAHRDREIARVRERQAATVAFLRELRGVPCADCGGLFAAHQMDFDHRDPSQKSFRITAGRAMLMSRDRLLAEIAKCDIVCANCHRLRTLADARRRVNATPLSRERGTECWRASRRAQGWHLATLRDRPCLDCGVRFLPFVMEFDHRDPTEKRFEITRMIGRAGLTRILAEAAKCDIVCANCHRERTLRRRSAVGSTRE